MGTSCPRAGSNITTMQGRKRHLPGERQAELAGRDIQGTVRISGITDGTSNTILFGERAQGKFAKVADDGKTPCDGTGNCPFEGPGWWADADYGDAVMCTFYPINIKGADILVMPNGCDGGSVSGMTASSFHPGGAVFAFADGSVRFLKDSINSWNWPLITRDANCLPVIPAGTTLGVYQALSTRAGNEVISADQY